MLERVCVCVGRGMCWRGVCIRGCVCVCWTEAVLEWMDVLEGVCVLEGGDVLEGVFVLEEVDVL